MSNRRICSDPTIGGMLVRAMPGPAFVGWCAVPLAAGLLGFGPAPVGLTAAAPNRDQDLRTSALPRLRPLWSVPNLIEVPSPPVGRSAFGGGIVLARTPTSALVALDLQTGRELWRKPMADQVAGRAQAGDLLLAYRSSSATAMDTRTGQERWTRRVCPFYSDLTTFPEVGVGIATCQAPDLAGVSNPGAAPAPFKAVAAAIDLSTGRELWRMPTGQFAVPVAASRGRAYVVAENERSKKSVVVYAVDPRSGKPLTSFSVPHVPRRVEISPKNQDRMVFLGEELAAVDLTKGRVVWSRPGPPSASQYRDSGPVVRDDRLVAWWGDELRELDLRTGAEVGRWSVPAVVGPFSRATAQPAPGGGVLVIASRGLSPALALRFSPGSAEPTLAVLRTEYHSVVGIEAGVVVVREGLPPFRMEGYAALETIPSEATALDPLGRVRAILEREGRHFVNRARGERELAIALEELRNVPGFEGPLFAMARDVESPWHEAAIAAAAAARIPSATPLLLAEVMRPLELPDLTGKTRDERLRAHGTVPESRAQLIEDLAELDDPKVADAFTPLLFDAGGPPGFGRREWERWGFLERAAYRRTSWAFSEPESAFSPCLQAASGRPAAQAATYRLLARLGRRADIAALRRFDAENGRTAGWANICAADDAMGDALKEKTVEDDAPPVVRGLCHGWDVPGYRVAQSEAVWLRRRLPGGGLGPPAWAADPGGDPMMSWDRRPIRQVALNGDGAIQIEGDWLVLRPLVPADVFTDRDRDGLPDRTERALGTDPHRADTDGDGMPDGRDPAPLAPPARTEAARVHDEIVRYWTTFRTGGPLVVYADRASWGGGGGAAGAGVVLHRPFNRSVLGSERRPFCRGRAGQEIEAAAPRTRGRRPHLPAREVLRMCELSLAIESVEVRGARARAITWPPGPVGCGTHVAHELTLRKIAGVWRVSGDRALEQPSMGLNNVPVCRGSSGGTIRR